MKGGIAIRKKKYEVLLLTGIATCLFGLFLLFLLFYVDTKASQKAEIVFIHFFDFWTDRLIEDNHKVNSSTSEDQIELESTSDSPTMTSPDKVNDYQTSSPSALDQQLLYSYQENTTLPLKEMDSYLIELLSIHSALQSYKEVNHYYPKTLQTLTLEYPNNYLTVIPKNTHYIPLGKSYVLSYKGHHISSNQKEKIELHFYPLTNELVMAIADLPLARYSTASGKNPLPFKESKIEERVMNPNGGEGPLGTRGLVLQDHYAIHGTNNPASIGSYKTLGCIRLLNENIETLYPYIPIGTSIKVKEGKAPAPVFSHGLPVFDITNFSKGENRIINRTRNNNSRMTEGAEDIKKIDHSPKNTKCECSSKKTFHWRG